MFKVASTVLALVVSLVLVDSLSAQQKGRPQGHRGGWSVIDRVEKVKDLKLTDDQKAKLAELKKMYAPKTKALADKAASILTPDQKKARQEAMKAARESGKRPDRESIQATMKLTDAQKAKMADGRKAMVALNKEITDKVNKVLTTEQQDVLKKALASRGNHGHRGHGGNKPQPSA
jgi:Spy/CpxP family protein refolding chaperone